MKKIKRILNEQSEDETGVDAAVARGQNQVPLEKIEAFKNTISKMYDATTNISSAGSSPTQAAASSKKPGQTGETSNTGETTATQKKGSSPSSQEISGKEQVKQSVSKPEPTSGFVELEKDASEQALDFLSGKLNVDKESIKKLSMTRGVRVLLDPKYLKIQ